MVQHNPLVEDVWDTAEKFDQGTQKEITLKRESFEELQPPLAGKRPEDVETDGIIPGGIEAHIQGLALWDDTMLLTTNHTSGNRAKLAIIDRDAMETSAFMAGPDGYPHGGGGQAIGDLGVVAFETNDYSRSHVQTYQKTTHRSHTVFEPTGFSIEREDKGAGSCAATQYLREDCHMLAVADNGSLDIYQVDDLADSNSNYEEWGTIGDIRSGNNINMVTDIAGRMWLFNFWSEDETTTFGDRINLYQVIPRAGHRMLIKSRVTDHKITTEYPWWIVAKFGVHCRFAAGMDLQNPDHPFRIWVTARNFKSDTLYVNYLDP